MLLLRPTLEYRQGSELVAHLLVPEYAIWFRGHFPDRPILPGVAILATVGDAVGRLWPDADHPPVALRGLHRVRFRQIIGPGTNLRIHLRQTQPDRLRFAVEAEGLAVANGECIVETVSHTSTAGDLAALVPRSPARLAARFCSDGTTVGAVADRAAQLCRLRSGAGPTRVCVASEDRVDVAAAVWAALSGGTLALFPPALTIDAMLATQRLQAFSHWLGQPAWRSEVPPGFAAMAVEFAESPASSEALGLVGRDEPCVFLHTGGSTGTPRSWAKTARNLLEEVAIHVRGLQVDPEDHILATVPAHHIYGLLFSVLLPLCSGATVERWSPFFPQEIAERIAQTSATILVSTPAHLKALANVMTGPHHLRLVLSSGAPLAAADAQGFFARTGLWPLEVYGSTETGGIAVRRQDVAGAPWHPLPGVTCHLDGEVLAVRSAFASSGASVDGEGFFRTGDLASLRPDGGFDLAGRADGVVKVGGVRVLLPEVEKAILALGQVSDAVVLALPSDSGRGQDIVALVASPRPAEAVLHELRAALPSPSWPRRLRTVEAIPTTPSGKRDRSLILALLEATEDSAV
jgi:acyl-CoA synthetase (AMP-forming)/AMP-acid ligase II/3-hydroxymyristoyl/3-hydroxydecanoyl-(acyl carrier protein) dehydratase